MAEVWRENLTDGDKIELGMNTITLRRMQVHIRSKQALVEQISLEHGMPVDLAYQPR